MFATGCQRDYMSSDLLFQPKRISSDSKKGYHQKQSHTKPNIGCLGSLANAKVLGCLRLESSLLWLVNLPATTELGVLLPCHPNPADRWPRQCAGGAFAPNFAVFQLSEHLIGGVGGFISVQADELLPKCDRL